MNIRGRAARGRPKKTWDENYSVTSGIREAARDRAVLRATIVTKIDTCKHVGAFINDMNDTIVIFLYIVSDKPVY